MAFRFKKASCVVVGTFNMYILHPQWLAKRKIIERGMEVAIESNLARPGVRFRLAKYDAMWAVSPDRVVIESTNAETDCGAIIAKVLEALPETPLFAIGNNATYEAGLGENLSDVIRNFPQIECPAGGGSVEQRTFHVGVRKGDKDLVNLQLSLHHDKIELGLNSHRNLDGNDANSAAIDAARHFFPDRQQASDLARHFFGSETEHGSDDN